MPLYKMLLARFTSIQLFKMLVNHTFYGMQQYVRTDGNIKTKLTLIGFLLMDVFNSQ